MLKNESFECLNCNAVYGRSIAVRKFIFGIAVSVLCCSAPVAAADVTWHCSMLVSKTDKKPTAIKFVIKGNELIDENVWPDAFLKQWELQRTDVPVTKYKIVKNTDKSLVAIHSDERDNEISAMIVVIDKATQGFRQIAISTKTSEPWPNFEGTCTQ
jgi:hypothetical protein